MQRWFMPGAKAIREAIRRSRSCSEASRRSTRGLSSCWRATECWNRWILWPCTVFRSTGIIGNISEWPKKLEEIRAVAGGKAIWVSEAGASSFGAEEVQLFGLKRSAELLLPRAQRVHWYSLFDLPATWTATTRHKEAEGSAYYRHYYMGLYPRRRLSETGGGEFPSGPRRLPVVPL